MKIAAARHRQQLWHGGWCGALQESTSINPPAYILLKAEPNLPFSVASLKDGMFRVGPVIVLVILCLTIHAPFDGG